MKVFSAIRYWRLRHYAVAASVAVVWAVLSGTPTDIVDTPLFIRMTPVVWWDYPFWAVGTVLIGLLAATYVPTSGVERLVGLLLYAPRARLAGAEACPVDLTETESRMEGSG